jgi:hypothetical protein
MPMEVWILIITVFFPGYDHHTLITPNTSKGKQWNLEQKAKRVIVEIVFGNIKTWEVAKLVYCGSPEMQTIALMVVYQLVAEKLAVAPLRQ